MIRTLIVDDEPYAREELAELLASDPDIEILGMAGNAIEALGLIQQLKPDVVFLDIQMPKLSGMELVAMLDPLPRIVFVTAFDDYAIQAFEENAFDYLLKPVEPARLAKTLARLRQDITRNRSGPWPRPSTISPDTCTTGCGCSQPPRWSTPSPISAASMSPARASCFTPSSPSSPWRRRPAAALSPPVSGGPGRHLRNPFAGESTGGDRDPERGPGTGQPPLPQGAKDELGLE